MAQLREITGKFTMSNDTEVHFEIYEDYGWSQWGSGDAGLTVDALQAMVDGLKDAEIEVGATDDDPEPGPCPTCGERVEPDDGGALWYHADTMRAFCDPEGEEDLTRQASDPNETKEV